jgi:hypothetical protein
MSYDLTPSDQFDYTLHVVGREEQPVVVVDGFLRDPDSMVRFAVDEAVFAAATSDYPGVLASVPAPYVEALLFGLDPQLRTIFGVDPAFVQVLNSFYGIVTRAPTELKLSQQVPHFDNLEPGALAVLHYFCDSSQGGTAFYRHRATGYESIDSARVSEFVTSLQGEMRDAPQHGGGYIATSNRLFEQTERIEARFNRLLVYRSRILHSGQIGPTTSLSADPRTGRLTTNTFLRFAG